MNLIEEAQRLKSRAVKIRERDPECSERFLLQARQLLLENMPVGNSPTAGPMEIEIATQMANICGSLGGTYRAWGHFEDSVRLYDEGYHYEARARYGIVNSYNLVQRLVARVLLDPEWAIEPERTIEGEPFPAVLTQAAAEIEKQLRGPRQNDEYALADQAMIALLAGRADHLEIWSRLKETAKNQFVLDATSRVLEDILRRYQSYAQTSSSSAAFQPFLNCLSSAQEALR